MFQITDVYKTVSTLARKFTFGKLPDIHHKLLLLHQLQILYFTHTLISIISSPVFILHSSDNNNNNDRLTAFDPGQPG